MADGNTAAALGAIYGGVQFASWYPITPATSLAEGLLEYLPVLRKDPGDGQEHLRGRAGRRRAGSDRHGGRRRVGWIAGDDLHLRSWPEPDDRVRRAGIFRRSAAGGVGRAARRARAPACPPAPHRAI